MYITKLNKSYQKNNFFPILFFLVLTRYSSGTKYLNRDTLPAKTILNYSKSKTREVHRPIAYNNYNFYKNNKMLENFFTKFFYGLYNDNNVIICIHFFIHFILLLFFVFCDISFLLKTI